MVLSLRIRQPLVLYSNDRGFQSNGVSKSERVQILETLAARGLIG